MFGPFFVSFLVVLQPSHHARASWYFTSIVFYFYVTVSVLSLFLTVSRVGLQCAIVVFPRLC